MIIVKTQVKNPELDIMKPHSQRIVYTSISPIDCYFWLYFYILPYFVSSIVVKVQCDHKVIFLKFHSGPL